MGIGEFVNDSRRILRLATKPSRSEVWLSVKIGLLAMFMVGFLSYMIQIVMNIITSGWVGQ